MNYIVYLGATYPIFIAIIYALLCVIIKHEKVHHIRNTLTVIGGAIIAYGVAIFLKGLFKHPRPDLTQALFVPNDIYSFPSGHATFMFTLVFIMYAYDKRAYIVLLFLAVITSISRVLAGVHYWYDIIGGIILAFIIAQAVLYSTTKLIRKM